MASIEAYATSRGEKRYRVRYRKPDGRSTDKRGFKRKKDAAVWMSENVISALADGTYVDPTKGRTRFGKIYEKWIAANASLWKPSHFEPIKSAWTNHVCNRFAHRPIGSIRHSEIQEFVNDLAAAYSATTVLRCFDIVKGVFELAERDGVVRNLKPIENVNLPRKPERKENRHYLTPEQLVRLADCSGRYRVLVLVLGFCGLRWGEAAALRPDDIDVMLRRIHVRRSITKSRAGYVEGTPKSYEVRDVAIPSKLIPLLENAISGKTPDERIFTDPDGHVLRHRSIGKGARGWWIHALNDAGLEPMVPHDLRHTAASIAISSGANVKAVQRMLGHKSAAVTLNVYADLFDSDLDIAADNLDAKIPMLDA